MPAAIYLDHNATTPLRPEARAAMVEALDLTGNASSVHQAGRTARHAVERARRAVAAFVNAPAEQVIFTSGGTESNALALHAFPERAAFCSAIEHDSVLVWVPAARHIPVTPQGVVDMQALDRLLTAHGKPALVSVMMANNETGVIQPIADVVKVARAHGALVHVDAVQAAGRMPLDFAALDVDMMSLSAHKIGGPLGVGALIFRKGLDPQAYIRGGGQERRHRAGTENIPAILGFGAAVEVADPAAFATHLTPLRDELIARCLAVSPASRLIGGAVPRLPNTINLTMPGVTSDKQVMALDLAGFAVSAGSACSSGKVSASHVLKAMGLSDDEAACALRFSLGWTTTQADIEAAAAAWIILFNRLVLKK